MLELGAAGGLPSLVAAVEGASKVGFTLTRILCWKLMKRLEVVTTDFPDASLIDNLQHNIRLNALDERNVFAKVSLDLHYCTVLTVVFCRASHGARPFNHCSTAYQPKVDSTSSCSQT